MVRFSTRSTTEETMKVFKSCEQVKEGDDLSKSLFFNHSQTKKKKEAEPPSLSLV
jgi:hypothetical protein